MRNIVSGFVAAAVGGILGLATVVGVLNVMNGEPQQPEASVMDYGTNQTD